MNILERTSAFFQEPETLSVWDKYKWEKSYINTLIYNILRDLFETYSETEPNVIIRLTFVLQLETVCPPFLRHLLSFPQGIRKVSKYFLRYSDDFYDLFEGYMWLQHVEFGLLFELGKKISLVRDRFKRYGSKLIINCTFGGKNFRAVYKVRSCYYCHLDKSKSCKVYIKDYLSEAKVLSFSTVKVRCTRRFLKQGKICKYVQLIT